MTGEVLFATDGTARFIHDDDLLDVAREVGTVTIRRASHVEPTDDGRWTADMGPCGGPVLGPWNHRADALSAERAWLVEHGVPVPAP